MNIYLIGFMGSGKSTIGACLAEKMNYNWFDLDEVIVERNNRSVAQIFTNYGELFFRKEETTVLRSTAALQNTIISCGGGTPCFFDNMAWINRNGVSVFIDPSVEILLKRLTIGKDKRPLLRNKSNEELLAYIEEKLKERRTYYEMAQIHYFNEDFDADACPAVLDLINNYQE